MPSGGCARENRRDGHHSRHLRNEWQVSGVAHVIVVVRLWGCLTLAGLLLAGCSFKPGGSSGSDPDSDAGGGFSDGLPDPDGGASVPDGAQSVPDATLVEPVLLETLTVESNGNTVQSSFPLLAGVSYRLVVAGDIVVRDDELGRYRGDADYWYGGLFEGEDSFNGVDYGVAIDDTDVDGERSPDWGEFADSHNYETTFAGTGSQLTAQYHDSNYGNGNSGSLSLEIWGPPL